MKVIAFYLPQFHEIPENNDWWGEGFTEWVNVKKAKPLFSEHYQPRVPLGANYYDLKSIEIMRDQISLAKKNGIYGFCFYHYWFNGHLLLEKPVEKFLKNESLEIKFCLSWANESWTKAWVSKNDTVLIEQYYGEEKEWEMHFNYLLPYFKDRRYIKENNKPLFVIYRPEQISCLNEMLDYWQKLAIDNGFEGIDFAFQQIDFDLLSEADYSRFTYDIEYEPAYAAHEITSGKKATLTSFLKKLDNVSQLLINRKLSEFYLRKVRVMDYDSVWEASFSKSIKDKSRIAGAFVDWDNTPRRGTKGVVYHGASPEKFKEFMIRKIKDVRENYSNDMIFLFAWNEWAEGGYMEPDEKYKDGYLRALRSALIKTKEFPEESD